LIHTPGGPTRSYGWLDKVVSLTTPDGQTIHYSYWPDGQLAAKQAGNGDLQEHFLWDGLALIRRNDTIYIIEPHPSGGVPIASHPVDDPKEITWYLNDLLGSTLATVDHSGVHLQNMTTYGQQLKVADTITKVPTTPTGVSGVTIPNPVPATPTFPSKL
jgi:YD repeat-containing protein